MSNSKDKIYLTWDDIDQLTDIICEQVIKANPSVNSVSGLARGGLIPAVIISHKLNLPYALKNHSYFNTLLIDDICDTGKTLNNLKNCNYYTAVLHYKPTSIFKPTWYGKEIGDEWQVYPWELKDSETIQDYLASKN
jgi:hypoxanthine phosphoribosyltransferase